MIIRRVFAFIFICSLTIATKASADFCVKIHNPLSGATSFTNKPHEDEQTFFVQNPTNESQTLRYYLNSDKEQKLTTVILPLSVVAIKANSLEILAPLRKHSDGLCKNFNSTYYDYDQFKDKSLEKTNVIALLTSRIEFFISSSTNLILTLVASVLTFLLFLLLINFLALKTFKWVVRRLALPFIIIVMALIFIAIIL